MIRIGDIVKARRDRQYWKVLENVPRHKEFYDKEFYRIVKIEGKYYYLDDNSANCSEENIELVEEGGIEIRIAFAIKEVIAELKM